MSSYSLDGHLLRMLSDRGAQQRWIATDQTWPTKVVRGDNRTKKKDEGRASFNPHAVSEIIATPSRLFDLMVRFVPVVEEVQVAPITSARPLALAPVHGANERSVRGLYGERNGGSPRRRTGSGSRSRPSIARSGRPAPGSCWCRRGPSVRRKTRLSGQTRRGVGGPVPC